mmetsp:Transcript_10334/g.15854  ORF Transcript_10334/g.15854 Transcript_10334/m.15854 type:complete len:234 (+) Transcript_10334:1267-1968(+)
MSNLSQVNLLLELLLLLEDALRGYHILRWGLLACGFLSLLLQPSVEVVLDLLESDWVRLLKFLKHLQVLEEVAPVEMVQGLRSAYLILVFERVRWIKRLGLSHWLAWLDRRELGIAVFEIPLHVDWLFFLLLHFEEFNLLIYLIVRVHMIVLVGRRVSAAVPSVTTADVAVSLQGGSQHHAAEVATLFGHVAVQECLVVAVHFEEAAFFFCLVGFLLDVEILILQSLVSLPLD